MKCYLQSSETQHPLTRLCVAGSCRCVRSVYTETDKPSMCVRRIISIQYLSIFMMGCAGVSHMTPSSHCRIPIYRINARRANEPHHFELSFVFIDFISSLLISTQHVYQFNIITHWCLLFVPKLVKPLAPTRFNCYLNLAF